MYTLENDTTTFNIDDFYISFESGLPKMVYTQNETISDGAIIDGVGSIGGRTAKVSRAFLRTHEYERDQFLQWFSQPVYKDIYLRRNSTWFNGIVKVYTAIEGGEAYKTRDFNFVDGMDFSIFMTSPYFESTTLTTISSTLVSSTQHILTVNISGYKCYPCYSITSTNALTMFEVKTAEGYGFRVDYNFNANDVINITTSGSQLIMTINGIRVDGYFTEGSSPFELQSSNNTLYVTGSASTFNILYYERHL